MTSLFQAYAACSVTMAAVTGGLFVLSPWLFRRYRARTLYIAWLLALVGFLIPLRLMPAQPALTAQIPAVMAQPVFAQESAAIPAFSANTTVGGAQASVSNMVVNAPAPTKTITWTALAALVWLLGAVGFLAVQFTRHALFLRTVHRWQRPITQPETLAILEDERRQLHIRRPVPLLLCPAVNSPMMIGLLRPRLLLPDEELTQEELPLVFRHELTHLKRLDLWMKAGLVAASALHWFNPAVHALSRTLAFWQEASCDEAVTAKETQEGKQFYSETIIRVIRRQSRMKSLVTTSFYGGKSGMKRRILAILEAGSKRAGAVVCLTTLLVVSTLGMAFAVSPVPTLPVIPTEVPLAYVARESADGAPMLFAPTVNDLRIPLAAYFDGVPVTIVEKRASSSLSDWGYKEGEENWANVLVGGDGVATGISGWIPLKYLSDKPATLPTATLTTTSPSGHVNVYTLNDSNSNLVNTLAAGTRVTLLGRVQKWYQIEVGGVYGFVPMSDLTIDTATQTRFETFLPPRFDDITRAEYQKSLTFSALYAQKKAEYGGKEMDYWSLEDKAWYGQLEETYIGAHDHYYQLPQAGDLQTKDAVDIAWNAFITDCKLKDAKQDDYDFNLGFYSIPDMDKDKKSWRIGISRKHGGSIYWIELASPGGEVEEKGDAQSYLAQAQNDVESAAYQVMAQWEKERGQLYRYWPLEVKADFRAKYGIGVTVLPDEKAITREKAVEWARETILTLYEVSQEEMDSWEMATDFWKPDKVLCWSVEFFDASGNSKCCVWLDAYTGAVLNSWDPNVESHG